MTDPLDISRQRIAEEAEAKTGTLDLSGFLELRRLPDEIRKLTHLQILNYFDTSVSDLAPLEALASLTSVSCSRT